MSRFLCRNLLLTVLVLMLSALPSAAAPISPEALINDFKPVKATLVMPLDSEWLIDVDASHGVKSGDLFSVVRRGKPVIHPVSKEIIGSIDTVRGVLQVTKVKSGYSYAKVLNVEGELEPGVEVRRFYNQSARLWDYTGNGQALFLELQAALPHLEWQSYAEAQETRPVSPTSVPGATGLLFLLTDEGLAVKDNNLQPIRFYQQQALSGERVTSNSAGSANSAYAPGIVATSPRADAAARSRQKGFLGKVSDQLFGKGDTLPGTQIQAGRVDRGGLVVSTNMKQEGVWYGPRMHGQPVGVEVVDLDGDGKQEVAIAFRDRLVVGRSVDGKLQQLGSYEFSPTTKPLSIDGADLDHDGKAELYLTAVNGLITSSSAFEWQDGQLVKTLQNIPWFLRRVTLPGEGDVLLGQVTDPKSKESTRDYRAPVFRVGRSGDELTKGAAMTLPNQVVLNGFIPYDVGGHSVLLNINTSDKLQLLEKNGNLLWESSDYYGGTQNFFERQDPLQGSVRYRFVQQRLEPGPENTVLVPFNKGSRMTGWRKYQQSHIEALTYDGYSMVERWRTKPQNGYLADYRLADADNDGVDEIVMIVQFAQGGWLESSEGISALLFYEMQ